MNMAELSTAPTPGLAPAFRLTLQRSPAITVGEIGTGGTRSYSPASGLFEGEGLRGQIVGGGELHLARMDGVTAVEASYYIAFEDGACVRCFGNGYRTRAPDFAGLRLALLFEAAEASSVAYLANLAFVGEQADGDATLVIERIV
jgi:hypothetical protein